jgi:hypothetical protein
MWRVATRRALVMVVGLGLGAVVSGGPAFAEKPEDTVATMAPAEGWWEGWRIRGLSINGGRFGIFRGVEALEAGMEMQFRPRYFRALPDELSAVLPVIGGMRTGAGTSYVYLGFRTDFPLEGRWVVSPLWGVGLYSVGGEGRDLGGRLEFRSGFDVAYQFKEDERIGLTLYHLSNAGLYGRNPGSESLVLSYSRLFRPR